MLPPSLPPNYPLGSDAQHREEGITAIPDPEARIDNHHRKRLIIKYFLC